MNGSWDTTEIVFEALFRVDQCPKYVLKHIRCTLKELDAGTAQFGDEKSLSLLIGELLHKTMTSSERCLNDHGPCLPFLYLGSKGVRTMHSKFKPVVSSSTTVTSRSAGVAPISMRMVGLLGKFPGGWSGAGGPGGGGLGGGASTL
jgi:hypothetical protein